MGKGLNPADAQRKAERKREVRKNKAARSTARADKLLSNPAALREELERWRRMRPGEADEETGAKLDASSIANRVRKLETAYAELLKKKKVRSTTTHPRLCPDMCDSLLECLCPRSPPVLRRRRRSCQPSRLRPCLR